MDFFIMTSIGMVIMSLGAIIGILYRSNRTLRLSSVLVDFTDLCQQT